MIWFFLFCTTTACSDDLLGVLGNERLCWSSSLGAEYYEVATDSEYCGMVLAPETCVDLWPFCRGDLVTVRPCNDYGCADWAEPVEVLPWLCIEGDREVPCFPGAPLRLPSRTD